MRRPGSGIGFDIFLHLKTGWNAAQRVTPKKRRGREALEHFCIPQKGARGMAVSVHVSEQQFMQAVIDLARLGRWLVYHTHGSRHSTAAGYPDLCLVKNTRLIFAELKSPHGRVTPAQAAWLQALGAVQTVHAAVWRPGDWDVIERRLLR